MADGMSKRIHIPGRLRIYNSRKSKESMHCLVCDTDVATHTGYNILYTVLGNGRSLLCDNINKVLRRELDAVTARSTILCKRCFSLFDELDIAESRCNDIKKEIESYYLKTCEVYGDELPVSVTGVACQTENAECDSIIQSTENKQGDIKLKIALVSKRKRGRPVKAQQKKRGSIIDKHKDFSETVENNEVEKSKKPKEKSIKKENENINDISEVVLESRRTRSTAKSLSRRKSTAVIDIQENSVKNEQQPEEGIFNKEVLEHEINDETDNVIKVEENPSNEGEVFSQEYLNNDDDDFEWKEEPLVEIHDESPESDDDGRDDKSGDKNDDDWHSSGSKDSKKRQKRKKKRKRGDRRGERAFMVPIHECNQCGKKWRTCDLCGKRFIHQKSFNIHKMTHTGEKNIHCPICKLAVFSQSHLKRHYRVHTGERPYGCTICGKKFAEKYNLNAHTRIHDPNSAGEGRRRCHTCPICGMTYDRKHKMADHLSSVHCMWQSSSLEFKSEDFYNMDVAQTQHHLLPLQVQHSASLQQQHQQPPPPQQQQQQQTHSHQTQPSQSQPPQINSQQQPSVSQSTQPPQAPQMVPAHQPQQHHHMAHHQQQQQQQSSHHLQHHTQSANAPPSHHILVTHQLQQTLQTHLSHHPVAAAAVVATGPSTLQPISSVFQLVSAPPTTADPSAAHHNRMNSVSASMPVPTL
ncbi:hypothetical protein PGB90_008084 [Kerria lacca]